ncbi:hypothetical protein [Prescottella equi]|uniref:hypothetical protein n=1 Tax=Rhodococcus hoagii TaxID=43767 RepID=UPI0011AA6FA2|nr:hypothetical protein [Prescottella equi]BCN54851.1 hypothetical protein RE9425_32410 [Prescottella equi]
MREGIFTLPRVNRAGDGWQSRSLRSILLPRTERNRADLPLLSVARERGVFVRSAEDANHNAIPEDLRNYKVAHAGDLVINKMKAWQGSLGLAPVDGIVSPAYFVFEADFAVARFGEYLLRSKPYVAEFGAASDGVRVGQWDLNIPRMRNIEVQLPPADEQAAIVKYLAHANARIDKAVAAKRRLIALLEEQIRTHAEVSISDVAAGAAQPLLGRAMRRIEQGMSPTASESDLADGQWAVLSLSAVNRGTFVASALKPVDPALAVPAGLELRDGDLLMTRSNTRDRVGDVAVVRGVRPKTFMSDLIYRLVLREDLLVSEYASVLLRTRRVRSQIESSARGSSDTMPKLAQGHIKALRIPLPTLDVQNRVVDELARVTKPMLIAVERTTREVTLLQEFRTRLVADVVTGQVDVRAIAVTLPDAPEAVTDFVADSEVELDEVAEGGGE